MFQSLPRYLKILEAKPFLEINIELVPVRKRCLSVISMFTKVNSEKLFFFSLVQYVKADSPLSTGLLKNIDSIVGILTLLILFKVITRLFSR